MPVHPAPTLGRVLLLFKCRRPGEAVGSHPGHPTVPDGWRDAALAQSSVLQLAKAVTRIGV